MSPAAYESLWTPEHHDGCRQELYRVVFNFKMVCSPFVTAFGDLIDDQDIEGTTESTATNLDRYRKQSRRTK